MTQKVERLETQNERLKERLKRSQAREVLAAARAAGKAAKDGENDGDGGDDFASRFTALQSTVDDLREKLAAKRGKSNLADDLQDAEVRNVELMATNASLETELASFQKYMKRTVQQHKQQLLGIKAAGAGL
jgi:recombinational DNA repair protein RecR